MKITDTTAKDQIGIVWLLRAYVVDKLGFDGNVNVEVRMGDGKGSLYISGHDKFQQDDRYEHRVGQYWDENNFTTDEDWAEVCKRSWEKLQKAMQRDERELRYGMKTMGILIERAPSFTSAVGKMIADRIIKTRDEAHAHMIEHHGWQPEAAE